MNLLVSVENFYPPRGGAELSFKTLFSKLAKKHKVKIVCTGPKDRNLKLENMEISIHKMEEKIPDALLAVGTYSESVIRKLIKTIGRNHVIKNINRDYYWKSVIDKELREFEPDIMFTQLNFTPSSVSTAVLHKVPTVVFLRSYEHLCPMGFKLIGPECERNCADCFKFNLKALSPMLAKINAAFSNKLRNQHRNALNEADCVIANSKYMAKLTYDWIGVKSEILYPFIEFADFKSAKSNVKKEYILFIKPTKTKGAEIVLKIVKKVPERKFLVLGRGNDEYIEVLKKSPNVKYIPWCSDMNKIYEKTWVVIIPSLWPEPFGRIGIEAGLNGIPSIASDTGGLTEAVGPSGIIINQPNNIDKWINAINKMDNSKFYNKLSKNAIEYSKQFQSDMIFEKFRSIIKTRLGVVI